MSIGTSPKTDDVGARLGPDASELEIRQAALSLEVLARNASDTESYQLSILGKEFVVLPGVFSPRYFDSTPIFTRHLPINSCDDFLEIGAGTGITSVMAALKGARKVVAVDINPNAVDNIVANALLHGVDTVVDARKSDVFSAIRNDEKFDSIYWNLPFIYVQEDFHFRELLEYALFDPGYNFTRTFMHLAGKHLKIGGKLYAGFGDFGDIRRFNDLAVELNYSVSEIVRKPGYEGKNVEFILYELSQFE